MSGKATPLAVPTGNKSLGAFHVETFNMFDSEERKKYESLRTRNNDRASGVHIEHLQQFSRKVIVTERLEGEGSNITTTTEDLHVLVQWWEKPIQAAKGTDGPREWSLERQSGQG